MSNLIENSCFWQKKCSQGVVCPCPWLYTYIWALFQTSPLKALCQMQWKSYFIWSHFWKKRKKVCLNFQGHMAKMAALPIYGENFLKKLLKNQKSYNLETWHAACGTKASQNLNKWWPLVALDLFFGKVKFCCLCIWIGKPYKLF